MEGQLLKVHCTQEALRIFSDGIAHTRNHPKRDQTSVSLTSNTRRKKENLESYTKRHALDENFAVFLSQVTNFVRGKLGGHIEPCDIWVEYRSL